MTSVVAPLVTLCCLTGAAAADAKAVWSPGLTAILARI